MLITLHSRSAAAPLEFPINVSFFSPICGRRGVSGGMMKPFVKLRRRCRIEGRSCTPSTTAAAARQSLIWVGATGVVVRCHQRRCRLKSNNPRPNHTKPNDWPQSATILGLIKFKLRCSIRIQMNLRCGCIVAQCFPGLLDHRN